MNVNPINAAGATESASSKAAATATDPAAAQDRFLKLLVAQLNNQDPMNPMDNAQMTSQMAQINTVTGIQQLNQTMQSMATQFNSLQVMQGATLVGRNVLTEGSNLAMIEGTGKGGFELPSGATGVTVEVTTAGGQVIDKLNMGARSAGRHTFDWDASQYAGAKDTLQFKVSAVNGSTAVNATALNLTRINAAGAQDGQLELTLSNGKTINYNQIKALV